MIKAIIFDLGGTLIEYAGEYASWPDLETPGFKAAHLFLRERGVALPVFADFCATGFALLPARWRGATTGERNLTVMDLLADLLVEYGVDVPPTAVLADAAEQYQTAVQAQAYPLPGAATTLAQLKAEGYRLGLISNTMFSGKAHLADLARFDMAGYFDRVLFSAEENKWKPNPAPFQHMLLALGVEAATAVFVGDDPANDVYGAQRAGLRAVHYQSSHRFHTPDGVVADAVITSLTELPSLLRQWQSPAP
jgi:HAD superfamily hydrolase (TIGR01509 family)